MPPSSTRIPSESATVIDEPLAVSPSSKFSSVDVDVIAVAFIASLPVTTLNVPLSSILAT